METVLNKEHLKEILTNGNKYEFTFDISIIGEVVFFTTINELENLYFERLGFKKWKVTRNKTSQIESKNRFYRIYPYFLILIGALLNAFAIIRMAIENWFEFEAIFQELPISASIISAIIISLFGLIFGKIFKFSKK